jgi:transposase
VAPAAPTRPQGGGRRRHGDREVLAAIVFVAVSDCPWQQLPPVFGPSGPTAHRRFAEWSAAHVWDELRALLRDAPGPRADTTWSREAVDAVAARAATHAR